MLEESRLQEFLFESQRRGAATLCEPLQELQDNYCFYCHEKLGSAEKKKPEVDHFIPWSRYADDSVANYVVAHRGCNASKKDFLAAEGHVKNWVTRLRTTDVMTELTEIAEKKNWKLGDQSSLGVAATIYTNLLPEVELWQLGNRFEQVKNNLFKELFEPGCESA